MEQVETLDQPRVGYIKLFIYMQILDLLTTLVGFRLGASEASPFIRYFMAFGPAAAVMLSKVVAMALLGICLRLEKHHLIQWISYWYAGLVVWNLLVLLDMRLVV
jgi:hypothetical protein